MVSAGVGQALKIAAALLALAALLEPLTSLISKEATGHIDVAFDTTKYGRGRAVDILDATNVTRDAQHRLVTLIMNSRFRPRPSDGAFDRASRVATRYYVYDGAPVTANH